MSKILLIITAFLIATSCNNNNHKQKLQVSTPAKINKAPAGNSAGRGDGSYERFMDSLISKKDIVFSKKPIEANMVFTWSDEDGSALKEPLTIQVGSAYFRLGKMDIVNDDDRLKDIWYDVDTAIAFTFKGRNYAYVSAYYHNCNGTGCMEAFYFIADLTAHKLHAFEMWGAPNKPYYFGDINNDGKLDFLVPGCDCLDHNPYCDTAEIVTLVPYTLCKDGNFVQMQNDYKRNKQLIGQFDDGIYGPNNFHIISRSTWDR